VSSISQVARISSLVVASILLASCQLRARLAIAEESTATNLVFVLSDWGGSKPGKLQSVYVSRCIEDGSNFPVEKEHVWVARATDPSSAPLLGRIAYGQVVGLTTSVTAEALAPGCYIARAWADFPDPRQGIAVFRVNDDGLVAVRDDA
jgi:hypothetical protein